MKAAGVRVQTGVREERLLARVFGGILSVLYQGRKVNHPYRAVGQLCQEHKISTYFTISGIVPSPTLADAGVDTETIMDCRSFFD
ncbi:MAG: hypothetical protein ACT4OO_08850 [Nitrospiraceae bacterium]